MSHTRCGYALAACARITPRGRVRARCKPTYELRTARARPTWLRRDCPSCTIVPDETATIKGTGVCPSSNQLPKIVQWGVPVSRPSERLHFFARSCRYTRAQHGRLVWILHVCSCPVRFQRKSAEDRLWSRKRLAHADSIRASPMCMTRNDRGDACNSPILIITFSPWASSPCGLTSTVGPSTSCNLGSEGAALVED